MQAHSISSFCCYDNKYLSKATQGERVNWVIDLKGYNSLWWGRHGNMKERHRKPAGHSSSRQREYTGVSDCIKAKTTQVIYFLQQDLPLKGYIPFPNRAAGLGPHAKTSVFVTDIFFSIPIFYFYHIGKFFLYLLLVFSCTPCFSYYVTTLIYFWTEYDESCITVF